MPGEITTVEIEFETNNALPATASILVDVPKKLIELQRSNVFDPNCFIEIGGDRIDFEEVEQIICSTDLASNKIHYRYAFLNYQSYTGRIKLLFMIKNAEANSVDIRSEAFGITIYDDASEVYGMDELVDSKLYPSVDCEWPCASCQPTDRAFCTKCLADPAAP